MEKAATSKGGGWIANFYCPTCGYGLISKGKSCTYCSKRPAFVASLEKTELKIEEE